MSCGGSRQRREGRRQTFYQRDGVWLDSEFKEGSKLPETVLVFGTTKYFALVGREPELARFFSLGERVVVVPQGARLPRQRAGDEDRP